MVFQVEQFEQRADVVALLRGVPEHWRVAVDHVAVPASVALPFDVAGFDEVGQDPLGGSERDADGVGDITQASVGVAGDAEQHLRVVGYELPALTRLAA